MKHLINNKTNIRAFDSFNEEYGDKLITMYPLLSDIKIDAVYYTDALPNQREDITDGDAIVVYRDPQNLCYAVIIVNEDLIRIFNFSEQEIHASIAHEIGHIICRFSLDKIHEEELICDRLVYEIGLGEPLFDVLRKHIDINLSENITDLVIRSTILQMQLKNAPNRLHTQKA